MAIFAITFRSALYYLEFKEDRKGDDVESIEDFIEEGVPTPDPFEATCVVNSHDSAVDAAGKSYAEPSEYP